MECEIELILLLKGWGYILQTVNKSECLTHLKEKKKELKGGICAHKWHSVLK